jgi:hypothetical protein
MKTSFVLFAGLLLGAAPAGAQTIQQRAYSPRQAEIRRQNYNQQEALRLLFGPQGIPALTRPSDPWNYNRARYYSQPRYDYSRPNYYVNPLQSYY